MPVRRCRSVEELNQPVWRKAGDPALYRAIAGLWAAGNRTVRRRFPPGVHRRRSIGDLEAATAKWQAESFLAFQSDRGGPRN